MHWFDWIGLGLAAAMMAAVMILSRRSARRIAELEEARRKLYFDLILRMLNHEGVARDLLRANAALMDISDLEGSTHKIMSDAARLGSTEKERQYLASGLFAGRMEAAAIANKVLYPKGGK